MQELLNEFMNHMREFRNEMNVRLDHLGRGLDETNQRLDRVEQGLEKTTKRLDRLEKGQEQLKKGQEELKESIKHYAILMTENFTSIRTDLRKNHMDVQADVNLLFKEVEGIKRHAHKIEQRIGM